MKVKILLLLLGAIINLIKCDGEDLLVVSVATERTDGFNRFKRSLNYYGYAYEIYGLGEEWRGGDVRNYVGGGQKVNILARELAAFKDDQNKILLFTDSYDVIIDQEPHVLLDKFKQFDAKIVFGAEEFCWPNEGLTDAYPAVGENEKRFLNSGGFIGYAPEIYKMITSSEIKDNDDDQLFYTKIFLDQSLRNELNIKLDTKSEIFQNLNGAVYDIIIKSVEDSYKVYNNVTSTFPVVIHGNGKSKEALNYLSNYLAGAYLFSDGCKICTEDVIQLDQDPSNWPDVTIGIFIERPTPFLREFFVKIHNLNYPKAKISILLHNKIAYHINEVAKFLETYKTEYANIKYIAHIEDSQEYEAKSAAIDECKNTNCKYYFSVDGTAHLDNPDTLKLLIEQNRPVIAPIMLRKDSLWSNFWGSITEKGFYLRSPNYIDIIEYKQVGVWNVPFINEAVLMTNEFINRYEIKYEDSILDSDMSFARSLRDQNVFIYATNMHAFGHLINPDSFNVSLTRPEMYEIFTNFYDWEKRYIRPDYYTVLDSSYKVEQPCPDVFWFPIVTEEFCESLIDMMEKFGKWSGGKNYDPRLPGGYENVPTVDIHMNQVGWESHWLLFLRKFVQPMQQKLFIGYFHDPPTALLNFVVRYKPMEQDHLKPHHDASTYTINIALNRPNVDFEGGGCRFVRYNCSVLDTRVGWSFIHPGRLTHYHEGLVVTKGTRYIMVSFIDP